MVVAKELDLKPKECAAGARQFEVLAVTIALPYSPAAGILGFTPLPVGFLAAMLALVASYAVAAELLKRWFYERNGSNS